MPTLASDKTSLNFDELQQNEQSEAFKTAYVKHCFNAAKDDLAQGDIVDGEAFLSAL
jgi:antitoxin Phd